jgi:NAD(P)-dependent dehydrogenase (short-subunit alcohol dehydrogenase family)
VTKTIVVCGYGPGISAAVAKRFGREGFQVALIARNEQRLAAGVAALEASGIHAAAFRADLGDVAEVELALESVRAALGPITVLHWNAYATSGGDLLAIDAAATRAIFAVPVVGLLAAVKCALTDLERAQDGALLVTNGGFGLNDAGADERAVTFNAMGLALANAAKRKLVGMLAQKLKPRGVYVGEVMVLGSVKGSAWDNGTATLEAATIADAFYDLYVSRSELSRNVR